MTMEQKTRYTKKQIKNLESNHFFVILREKGTVENIIEIIRRFYPKKTNWKKVSQWDLNKVTRYINNRIIFYNVLKYTDNGRL